LIELLYLFQESRLTGSELQSHEEAACTRPANATTGVLFTATNAVKFPSAVTQLSWVLYCLVIIELVHSYHVESVNLR